MSTDVTAALIGATAALAVVVLNGVAQRWLEAHRQRDELVAAAITDVLLPWPKAHTGIASKDQNSSPKRRRDSPRTVHARSLTRSWSSSEPVTTPCRPRAARRSVTLYGARGRSWETRTRYQPTMCSGCYSVQTTSTSTSAVQLASRACVSTHQARARSTP